MKVSGFSFIRNAIEYDYPVVEAVRSILPLCDDFYIAVGRSDDETLKLIQSIDPKINILETVWDENLRKDGEVLASETDKALKMIPSDSIWCFYIQGDEVVHEKDHEVIYEAMQTWKDYPEVDGLLFNYIHFYGSYDYIATSTNWYRKEIRIIRNNPSIYSYKDAQGFRKDPNFKLNVKPVNADIYHYGWVRHPKIQFNKHQFFGSLYNEDIDSNNLFKNDMVDYHSVDLLEKFTGSHPEIIKERIKMKNWHFDHDLSKNNSPLKHRFKKWVEDHFGFIPFEYRNYKII
jgi:hypothetical protein